MNDHLFLDDKKFYMVSQTKRGGQVLNETYFAADRSGLKVEIDYTFTEKGHK